MSQRLRKDWKIPSLNPSHRSAGAHDEVKEGKFHRPCGRGSGRGNFRVNTINYMKTIATVQHPHLTSHLLSPPHGGGQGRKCPPPLVGGVRGRTDTPKETT